MLKIVQKYGKKMVGWDEILTPDLPKDAIVQSWRGYKSLDQAARGGIWSDLVNHVLPGPYGPGGISLSCQTRCRQTAS